MINASMEKSMKSALELFEKKFGQVSSKGDLALIQELKSKQQRQEIEIKSRCLSSPGAASQYRSLAHIKLKVTDAVECLDDFLLSASSAPDDDVHKAINPIKELLEGAINDAEIRMNLIFKADSVPKHGWKAITVMEEKRNLDHKDPEFEKDFAASLKKV